MIYTVGNRKAYDEQIEVARKSGGSFSKLGANGDYPGGFAVRTIEDAKRLIKERGKGRGWAIYEVDADWERDTRPSVHGWWHGLIFTSRIVRRIVPDAPVRWCVQHRDGWCRIKGGKRPKDGSDHVDTHCGFVVTLPWGIERREPTCEECRK